MGELTHASHKGASKKKSALVQPAPKHKARFSVRPNSSGSTFLWYKSACVPLRLSLDIALTSYFPLWRRHGGIRQALWITPILYRRSCGSSVPQILGLYVPLLSVGISTFSHARLGYQTAWKQSSPRNCPFHLSNRFSDLEPFECGNYVSCNIDHLVMHQMKGYTRCIQRTTSPQFRFQSSAKKIIIILGRTVPKR